MSTDPVSLPASEGPLPLDVLLEIMKYLPQQTNGRAHNASDVGFHAMRRLNRTFYNTKRACLAPSLIWLGRGGEMSIFLDGLNEHNYKLQRFPRRPPFLNLRILALGAPSHVDKRDIASRLTQTQYMTALRGIVSLTDLYVKDIDDVEDALLIACAQCFSYIGSHLRRLRIDYTCGGLRDGFPVRKQSFFVVYKAGSFTVQPDDALLSPHPYDDISPIANLFRRCPIEHLGITHPGLAFSGIIDIGGESVQGVIGGTVQTSDKRTFNLPLTIDGTAVAEIFEQESVLLHAGGQTDISGLWNAVYGRACEGLTARHPLWQNTQFSDALKRVDLIVGWGIVMGTHLRIRCALGAAGWGAFAVPGHPRWMAGTAYWQSPHTGADVECSCLSHTDPFIPLASHGNEGVEEIWTSSDCYRTSVLRSPIYARDIQSEIIVSRRFRERGDGFESHVWGL